MASTTSSPLADLRRSRGLTQETLASRAGMQRTNLSPIENGIHAPRVSTVVRLAKGLGIDPEEVFRATVETLAWRASDDAS